MRKLRFRRRAVSNMVGGIIVLSLFIIALTAVVVVNQRYDAYETMTGNMSQKDIDRASEDIVALYPGLVGGFPAKCGGGCTLNQYNMSLANEGGVGVQIAGVYINSTIQASQPNQNGCSTSATPPGPCILNPSNGKTSFSFAQSDAYVASGEFDHIVRLWLPQGITLPNVTLTPSNSIWIVTNRGRIFSFNWPIPTAGQGVGGTGTPLNLEAGSMEIAYNGTGTGAHNSRNDPCHKETPQPLPAGGQGTTLYFLNPWITPTILSATTATTSLSQLCWQCLYVSVYSENTLTTVISFSWGQIAILTARASSNSDPFFLGGPYVGIVLNNQFYPYGTDVAVQPGQTFYLIFKIMFINYSPASSGSGDLFTGTATVNNLGPAYGTTSGTIGAEYQSFVIVLDGLYVRSGGC